MVVRLVLGTAAVVGCMSVVAHGTVLQRVGLTSSCAVLRGANGGAQLESCRAGWLDGYPNLSSHGCTSVDQADHTQLWSCPAQ